MLIISENPPREYIRRVILSRCYKHDCAEGTFLLWSFRRVKTARFEERWEYLMFMHKGKCSTAFKREMLLEEMYFHLISMLFFSDSVRLERLKDTFNKKRAFGHNILTLRLMESFWSFTRKQSCSIPRNN